MVVIPEELFFRGYVQRRLGPVPQVLPVVLTAALFAMAHVLAHPGWMRAAVFLPGLAMGWLRQRTDGLLAPTLFHWLANLAWLDWVRT